MLPVPGIDPIADAATVGQWAILIQERLDRRAGRKPDELTPTKRRDLVKCLQLAFTSGPEQEISHASMRDIAVFWTLTGDAPYPRRDEFKRMGAMDPYKFAPGDAVANAINRKVRRWKLRPMRLSEPAIRIDAEGALVHLLLRLRLRDEELDLMDPICREMVEHPKHHLRDPQELEKSWIAALDADEKAEDEQLAMHAYLVRTDSPVQEAVGRWFSGKFKFNRDGPPLSNQVAAFYGLTGRSPEWDHTNNRPLWNRGQLLDYINRLQAARGVKVDVIEDKRTIERVLNMPLISLSPEQQARIHEQENVVVGSPDWRNRWYTPWPNERECIDDRAALIDYGYWARDLYRKAVLPKVDQINSPGSSVETFLDARNREGYVYIFVKDAPQRENPEILGRIIKRRGKFYDEIPVVELGGDAQKIWDLRKATAGDPESLFKDLAHTNKGLPIFTTSEDVPGMLKRASLLSEDDLHDFWGVFGHNPPAYIKPLAELPEDIARGFHAEPAEPLNRRSGIDRRQADSGTIERRHDDRRESVDRAGLDQEVA